ncbi:MAG TPA: hypothetical protein VNS81_12110 [Nocardioides sp.]|nr:hypothetical protein [Nocardioides sp.]
MPHDLKNLMHETADLDFAAPDVAAIARAGDRRLRHRRLGAGVAGLAAAAVLAGGVVLAIGGDGPSRVASEPPSAPLPPGLSWAGGTVLHTSTGDIDTGHQVRAYVRAGSDFAFTDGQGAVFAVTGGTVERIGSIATKNPRLVSDPDGSIVAWLDPSGPAPAYHDYDLATGESGSWTAELGKSEFSGLIGVDGTWVVWRDEAGENAWNTLDGTVRPIDPDPPVDSPLVGVGGGRSAWEGSAGLLVGADRADALQLKGAYGGRAVFSPDGRWVGVDADDIEVWDVATATKIAFDVDGRDFAAVYEWLDADTVAAIAVRDVADSGDTGTSPYELLTCEVPSGACAKVLDLGDQTVFGKTRTVAYGRLLDD